MIQRLWSWLKEKLKPRPMKPGRRAFFRLAAGIATVAAVAPAILLEPAKAGANLLSSTGAMRTAGANWAMLEERVFFKIIMGDMDPALLPAIPTAPDGQALFASTSWDEKAGGWGT